MLLKFFNLVNMKLELFVKKSSFAFLITVLVSLYHHLSIKLSNDFCLNCFDKFDQIRFQIGRLCLQVNIPMTKKGLNFLPISF
jgi:hypothetical protein